MATTTGSTAMMVPKTAAGMADMSKAAAVTMTGGGMLLSPLPLSGGRRKTRRLSKKVLKMMKSMPKAKLAKLLKGGQEAEEAVVAPANESEAPKEGARRRKSKKASRKGSKKSRHAFLY